MSVSNIDCRNYVQIIENYPKKIISWGLLAEKDAAGREDIIYLLIDLDGVRVPLSATANHSAVFT